MAVIVGDEDINNAWDSLVGGLKLDLSSVSDMRSSRLGMTYVSISSQSRKYYHAILMTKRDLSRAPSSTTSFRAFKICKKSPRRRKMMPCSWLHGWESASRQGRSSPFSVQQKQHDGSRAIVYCQTIPTLRPIYNTLIHKQIPFIVHLGKINLPVEWRLTIEDRIGIKAQCSRIKVDQSHLSVRLAGVVWCALS